jgi:flagellum-specific peptidoglycan hydrolase FlgJ
MHSARKPRWQQVTALVSLSAGGAITGFNFVPKPAAELKSPTAMPIHLMALERSAQPSPSQDSALRSAIVNVANHYLRMAESRTPGEMEAIIWQHVSVDGVDHGPSCAAFASLALELGANAVGQQSWVTGGTSYPWPLHKWADARVDPNPASIGITSVLQDAQAHGRWHPLGDGYRPRPGDWVLFDGHVEVVTKYAGGVLDTVGGDSAPNLSVNAHQYRNPLSALGVAGFVDNGLAGAGGQHGAARTTARPGGQAGDAAPAARPSPGQPKNGAADIPGERAVGSARPAPAPTPGGAAIPGMGPAPARPAPARPARQSPAHTAAAPSHTDGLAAIPGVQANPPGRPGAKASASVPGTRPPRRPPAARRPAARPPAGGSGVSLASSQRTFIRDIVPGAIAAQQKYGVPAAVTIAQAIEESGWGRSSLASQDHNLFGMKGSGPAGSIARPSLEYENGQWITLNSSFRVYHDVAQSIDDHGEHLASDEAYQHAMSYTHNPDAFAAALTGVYATDPSYGAKLIALMRQYDLYQYDAGSAPGGHTTGPGAGTGGGGTRTSPPGTTPPPSTPPPSTPPPSTPVPGRPTPGTPDVTPGTPDAHPGDPGAPNVSPSTPGVTPGSPAVAPGSPRNGQGAAGQSARQPAARPGTGPGVPPVTARPAPGSPDATASPAASQGGADIPGVTATGRGGQAGAGGHRQPRWPDAAPRARGRAPVRPQHEAPQEPAASAAPTPQSTGARRLPPSAPRAGGRTTSGHTVLTSAERYSSQIPVSVAKSFAASAKRPLARAEGVYRDVCSQSGLRWELLAACDWMQCEARTRYSPVHGEKLGTPNPDGTVFRTRSAALEQCADDLIRLAYAVYGIDLTVPGDLSVRDLANVFAAFRWGALLRLHHTSAMEFPYSVAGLTALHTRMRWPDIAEPNLPDKPGGRFHRPFGAVPVVLMLDYPATA